MSDEPLPDSEIILYQTDDGRTRLEVRLQDETVWLSLNQMADLFQRDKSVISRHIKNVFDQGELSPAATVAKSATVQTEGGKQVTREIEFYNLDVIISGGYRVKSLRGTQFRIWATQRLREYIVKEFTMDDERLKQSGGGVYFVEWLERPRSRPSTARPWPGVALAKRARGEFKSRPGSHSAGPTHQKSNGFTAKPLRSQRVAEIKLGMICHPPPRYVLPIFQTLCVPWRPLRLCGEKILDLDTSALFHSAFSLPSSALPVRVSSFHESPPSGRLNHLPETIPDDLK